MPNLSLLKFNSCKKTFLHYNLRRFMAIKNDILCIDKAYWMVEDVFQKVHEDQMEKLAEKKISSSEPREIDGKMDKKKFLEYVQG